MRQPNTNYYAIEWERLYDRILTIKPLPEEGREERRARAKDDRFFFARTYLPHYFDREFGKMHRELAAFIDGLDGWPGLAIMARDHGKTSLCTVNETLWRLLEGHSKFAIVGSEVKDRAEQLARLVRLELEANARIKQDYGEQKSFNQWEEGDFVLRNGAVVRALGRGSAWRGHIYRARRPDWVVIDDLESKKNVRNPKMVQERIEWLRAEVFPAVKMDGGQLLIVGNKFSKRSALARLAENKEGEYRFRVFEAGAELRNGSPAWPQKFSPENLKKMREIMGLANYAAEMLNKPTDEGVLVKEDWIKWISPDAVPSIGTLRVHGFLDPSATASEASDFKALVTVGVAEDGMRYVLDSWIRRASPKEMLNAVYDHFKRFRHERIGMEKNMLHDFLRDSVRDAERRYGYAVPWQAVLHSENKELRISRIGPSFERQDEWCFVRGSDNETLVEQLCFYGSPGMNDDGPDALAGCEEMRACAWRAAGVPAAEKRNWLDDYQATSRDILGAQPGRMALR